MSSQHLEEADELADRICILTKGELLAIDQPDQIKRKFGVGYKILFERRTTEVSLDDFIKIKNSEIDPFILSEDGVARGIIENSDSTEKKLVY
jgi:ABC-type multidrug transport system ATPase subunit